MYYFKNTARRGLRPIVINNQVVSDRSIDFVGEDFVVNKYGHIRSDFAVLVDTNTTAELAKALSQMQAAYQENSSQFDGMTFEQMVATVRPRWCQLPGEVDRFEQYLIDQALDFYKELKSKIDDDTKKAIEDAMQKREKYYSHVFA